MKNIPTKNTPPPLTPHRLLYGNRKTPPNLKKLGAIAVLLIIIVAIPLTIFLTRQEQDIRQEAAVTASSTESNVCSAGNTDTFLVIDRSNSMKNPTSNSNKTPRINFARSAATKFVNIMSQETTNHIGIAQFGRNGSVSLNYTNNYNQVRNAIKNLAPDGPIGTCLECAILAVNDRVATRIKNGHTNKKFVIILSDGNANIVRRGDGSLSPEIDPVKGINQARAAIMRGHQQHGIVYYTIGLGQENNNRGRELLREVAAATKGKYYFAANASQLEQIYQEIAVTMGKGSISGSVLDDATTPLSEWDVLLKRMPEEKQVGKITTGSDGAYTFTSLCNATYRVELAMKDGFTLVSPTNPDYYELSVTKGEIHTGKNFVVQKADAKRPVLTCSPSTITLPGENKIIATLKDTDGKAIPNKTVTWSSPNDRIQFTPPSSETDTVGSVSAEIKLTNPNSDSFTETLTASTTVSDASNEKISCIVEATFTKVEATTSLHFTIDLHGIGRSGDNVVLYPRQCQRSASGSANLDECLSNQNPLHPERSLIVELFNQENKPQATVSGTMTYDNELGSFKGDVHLGDDWETGPYLLRVKTPGSYKRQAPGMHTITAGESYTVPGFDLVSSDVDNDDKLTVLDYNLIVTCYTFPGLTPPCDAEKATTVDVDDDGDNDEFDYNLFLRDLSVQSGDF